MGFDSMFVWISLLNLPTNNTITFKDANERKLEVKIIYLIISVFGTP